jgi:hypothetical protein
MLSDCIFSDNTMKSDEMLSDDMLSDNMLSDNMFSDDMLSDNMLLSDLKKISDTYSNNIDGVVFIKKQIRNSFVSLAFCNCPINFSKAII